MNKFAITEKQAQELYAFISQTNVSGKGIHAASRCMLILENLERMETEPKKPVQKLEKIKK